VVLIGHHVPRDHAGVERARAQGAEVIELPPDIAQDLDGSRTLALVERALAAEPPPAGPGADVLTEPLNDTVTDKGV
jgi:PTS system cellobiose-specific IIB component